MNPGPADPVRVLHFTDPHLFRDPGGALRGTVTLQTLNAVIADICSRAWPADLVFMTGDVIQDDTAEAYDRFVDAVSPLGLPMLCVPGNHDVRPLMKAALDRPPFRYCETVRAGSWAFTGIDSCMDDRAGGAISDDELERLRTVLADEESEHVAICLHHPPRLMNSKWLDSVGLENADEFLAIARESGNVRTAVFGHVHQVFDETVDDIRIIGTPSTCAQFLPLSDEFALDVRPPAYRRITFNPDGTCDTELMWLGEDE
jgi:Icc protein